MKFFRFTALTAFSVLVGVAFQNCTPAEFTMIDPEAKNAKLSTESVFVGQGEVQATSMTGSGSLPVYDRNHDGVIDARDSDRNGDGVVDARDGDHNGDGVVDVRDGDRNGDGVVDVRDGDTDGDGVLSLAELNPNSLPTENPADGSVNGNPLNGDLDVTYQCSDRNSDINGNLAGATNLRVEVLNDSRAVVCAFNDSSLRNSLMSTKKFSLNRLAANCGGVTKGRYRIRLRDPMRANTDLVVSGENVDRVSGGWKRVGGRLKVVADRNPSISRQLSDVVCDEKSSPLVIHMHADVEKAEPLRLTSPSQGVWFDIQGSNADPVAHTPRRISWHRSKQYFYIVLPDARGNVRGIDQLFGDNTLGPDGRHAADGFAALAKFDGMSADGRRRQSRADGYITAADAVFGRLRLWQDLNFDGVAQPRELSRLQTSGIEIIDLNFDAGYREVDSYGNETRYKSVVQDTRGRLHLLFDVWFNPQPLAPVLAPRVSRGLASVQ